MPHRFLNRTAQLAIDLAIIVCAYAGGFLLRFEGRPPASMVATFEWTVLFVAALQYGLIVGLRVDRLAWRYVGLPDVGKIGTVVGLTNGVLLVARLLWPALRDAAPWALHAVVPLSVIVGFGLLEFLGLVGVRVLRRMVSERREADRRVSPTGERVRTILIGAGRSGVLVAKEVVARPDLGIAAECFLDDDTVKIGTVVHGIPVVGTTDAIGVEAAKRGATQVLITMAAAPGKDIRRIAKLCEQHRLAVKIVPGLFEIMGGRVNLSRIRPVAIDDLLRREPVTLDEAGIASVVSGRVVLVTGAGGSIGSELCRQICRFAPSAVVLVEHGENNLFHIDRELRERFPDVKFFARMGDIRDEVRMTSVFAEHRPHVVFHAAAHKHVPMMEENPGEAIKNNVLGTKLLCELADAHGVSEFVMISTDKAVNPSSVMGASKRAAELVVQALSQRSKTRFVAVRFGNVLGSAGSVVPIFQEQIARGGPITVTHPEMRRYFMTIPEACQLVLQAAAMGKGGEIFVLDMGEPVRVLDLARDLITLSGLREGEDIEIRVTGMRPGEKLSEQLSLEEEQAHRTVHPKVFIGRIRSHPWAEVERKVGELALVAEGGDGERIREALHGLVGEYTGGPQGQSSAPPEVESPRASVSPLQVAVAVAASGRGGG